jgi:hypothetical protein
MNLFGSKPFPEQTVKSDTVGRLDMQELNKKTSNTNVIENPLEYSKSSPNLVNDIKTLNSDEKKLFNVIFLHNY